MGAERSRWGLSVAEAQKRVDLFLKISSGEDRKPVPEMTNDRVGQRFGNRGYVSQALFAELYDRGLPLVAKAKRNMKQRLMKRMDKILLRKRALIETVNDQLKNIALVRTLKTRIMIENQYQIDVLTRLRHVTLGYGYICQIKYSRHRGVWNCLVNLVAGLIAYTY